VGAHVPAHIDLATVFKTIGGREAAIELTGKYLPDNVTFQPANDAVRSSPHPTFEND
jgi:hypothetical protein